MAFMSRKIIAGWTGITLSLLSLAPALAAGPAGFYPPPSGMSISTKGIKNGLTLAVAHPLPPHLLRQVVPYRTGENAGTIVVNTGQRFLYLVLGGGKAIRYGIGVARTGFEWSGTHTISAKREWPSWTPPQEMLERQPHLPRFMEGGPDNPMGARGLYLGNTLYRIHGTSEPWTIGGSVSSGCIRMTNADVIDLYARVKIGARVVVI